MSSDLHDIGALLTPRLLPEYCPHTPTPPQTAFLLYQGMEALYGGAAGGGKAFALSSFLPTPKGWVTLGDLRVGDHLFDEKGKPCTVLALSEIWTGDCYEVEFSDGSLVVADKDHRWATYTSCEREQARRRTPEFRERRRRTRPQRGTGARPDLAVCNETQEAEILDPPERGIRTTDEIGNSLKVGKANRLNHSITVCEPLSLPDVELAVDPYVFGYWLGNGDRSRGFVAIGCAIGAPEKDWDYHHIVPRFAKRGYRCSRSNEWGWSVDRLFEGIIAAGVRSGTKSIPSPYLRASVNQRLELLQGLMDSDGYADDDCEFTTTEPALRDGVHELIISLGIKATVCEGRAMLDGVDHGPKWRIKFMTELPAFSTPRKLSRQKRSGFRGTHSERYIVDVRKTIDVPVRCIKVSSPSGLFLVGRSMIPTHNSDALLMAALQYVDVPGYRALLLRRTSPALTMPDGLLDRAHQWLQNTGAVWKEIIKTYIFPNPGYGTSPTLTFGFMEHELDKYRYQGSQLQFIGWDEGAQFLETQYTWMFTRIRKLEGLDVPLRMRVASNPPETDEGEWLTRRFIDNPKPDCIFIPAKFTDNPYLSKDYEAMLDRADAITIARQKHGNFKIKPKGLIFDRKNFPITHTYPKGRAARGWDFAGTPVTVNPNADFTAGAKVIRRKGSGIFVITHGVYGQLSPGDVEKLVASTAQQDGVLTRHFIEQEPGSAGKHVVEHYKKDVLSEYQVEGVPTRGDKIVNNQIINNYAEKGMVEMLYGPWNEWFLTQLELFGTKGVHDDGVDAIRLGLNGLRGMKDVDWGVI